VQSFLDLEAPPIDSQTFERAARNAEPLSKAAQQFVERATGEGIPPSLVEQQ
jgi:hypothetical protein